MGGSDLGEEGWLIGRVLCYFEAGWFGGYARSGGGILIERCISVKFIKDTTY